VSAEFLGLGRRFRERIADTDDHAVGVITEMFPPLARHIKRSAQPRPELLQGAAREWRQKMPAFGLLDSKTQLSRRELRIKEVRVGAGSWRYDPRDAQSTEVGIVILLVDFTVAPGICEWVAEPAAQLPLHALGRWYQRALDNREEALLADLGRLARAYGIILDKAASTFDPDFVCPAAGGKWVGSITRRFSEATQRQENILNVRTFLPQTAALAVSQPKSMTMVSVGSA
jgi:hypothetical protein